MALSDTEKKDLKKFLVGVYGYQANSWPMNDDMFDLTYKLLKESGNCSDLMDLVPRPLPVGKSASKWLTKQVRNILIRKLKDRKQHYSACVKAVGWKMKSEFNMKANGI